MDNTAVGRVSHPRDILGTCLQAHILLCNERVNNSLGPSSLPAEEEGAAVASCAFCSIIGLPLKCYGAFYVVGIVTSESECECVCVCVCVCARASRPPDTG